MGNRGRGELHKLKYIKPEFYRSSVIATFKVMNILSP